MKYPKKVEIFAYKVKELNPIRIIDTIYFAFNVGKCNILREEYVRKITNFKIELIVEGNEEAIEKAANQILEWMKLYAQSISISEIKDTEFEYPE